MSGAGETTTNNLIEVFMMSMNTPPEDDWGGSKIALWRLALRLLCLTAILALPFFQPGLWPISAITVFVLGGRISSGHKKLFAFCSTFLYLAAYVAVCIFVLPVVHNFTWASVKWFPFWGSALAAIALSCYLIFYSARRRWRRGTCLSLHITIWCAAVGLAGYCWLSSSSEDMVEWSMANALSPEKIDKLPDSDLNNFRLLPQARAQDFLKNANGDRTLRVSLPHMAPCNSSGKQCWESSFHLKGRDEGIWYNLLFDTVYDVAVVDPTDVNMNVQKAGSFSAFFLAGPESWVVKAAFAVHNPFSQQQEALFYRDDDGTVTMLIPYISYRPTFTGVMIPHLAGVMSVNRFGLINDMSVDRAKEKYPGVPFYPPELARMYSEIFAKWNGGVVGRAVTKRDELRISEPAEAAATPHFNQAPYIEVYNNGFGWQEVVALEPNSKDGKRLASLLFFDAATGYCKQYVVPLDLNINGPRQSMANSMQGNWEAQWALGLKVEPRPLMKDGRIYYTVGVLTTENDEHPYVHSIVIDGITMKPYPVLNHGELIDLIDKLSRGIDVAPRVVPSVKSFSN
jgi:hypothetical protein